MLLINRIMLTEAAGSAKSHLMGWHVRCLEGSGLWQLEFIIPPACHPVT